jgi:hypothetical protein
MLEPSQCFLAQMGAIAPKPPTCLPLILTSPSLQVVDFTICPAGTGSSAILVVVLLLVVSLRP